MRRTLCFVIFASWLAAAPAISGECPFPTPALPRPNIPLKLALEVLAQDHCAGSAADPSDLAKKIGELIGNDKQSVDEPERLLVGVKSSVALLSAFAKERAASQTLSPEWMAVYHALLETENHVDHDVTTDKPDAAAEALDNAIPKTWGNLIANPGHPVDIGMAKVQLVANPSCPAAGACPEFESRIDLIRVARSMERLRLAAQSVTLRKGLVIAQRENKRWNAYRTEGQHQYFWEVLLNSEVMKQENCVRKPDANGQDKIYIGFCQVPTSQWILLHPDAAFQWVHGATKTSELKPAFIIETVGFYRWDWGGDGFAAKMNERGISLFAAYADSDSGKRWSYGPMLHIGDYNLGLTHSAGNSWGITVNLKLAGRYFDARDKYMEVLKKIP